MIDWLKSKKNKQPVRNGEEQASVLFVCMGNICRSPTAEAVFKHKANQAGLTIFSDSAGTLGYHAGSSPDPRAIAAGENRGYSFKGLRARKVQSSDFEDFDYIFAMDAENYTNLLAVGAPHLHHKLHLFLAYNDLEVEEVPDPYYGGTQGFEYVLDLIEQASNNFIEKLKAS